MLTEETKKLILNLFAAISIDMKIVKEMQTKLKSSKTFNPRILFKFIADRKKIFDFNDLQSFLEYMNIQVSMPEIKYCMNLFYGVDQVDYQTFCEICLDVQGAMNSYDQSDFSDKLLLAKFIQSEINLIRDLLSYVRAIINQSDFTLRNMMKLISGREEYYTEQE